MKTALGILAMLVAPTTLFAAAPQQVDPVRVVTERQKSEEHGQKLTSLHVQVTFNEYEGEKKIASLPYTFDLAPRVNDDPRDRQYGRRAELRSGVYIPFTSAKGELEHEHVGTDIDCEAADLSDGRYALHLVLERNWLLQEVTKDSNAPGVRRQVRAEAFPTLHDGQTIEAVVSTDPMNGHVYRVTVTANVAK
jgi:hypothetical protein